MDIRDGTIYDQSRLLELFKGMEDEKKKKFFKEMLIAPTSVQLARNPAKIGRNEPCPCGSGKKFKKCCLIKQESEINV